MILAYRTPDLLQGLKKLPKRLLLGKWGRNDSVKGAFEVNATTAALLPEIQKALGFDRVALDFEHNTVPGTEAYAASAEPRKVAGHGTPRVVEGEGLYVEDIEWTPEGRDSVLGGHHPDISPAIKTNDAGEVVFLHSGALCRQGAVPDLMVFAVAQVLSSAQLQAFSAAVAGEHKPTHTHTMDYKKMLLSLLALLGEETHSADTDDKALEASVRAAETKLKKPPEDPAKTPEEGKEEIRALSATIKDLGGQVGALQKRLDESERARIHAEALAAGKIIPHSAADLPLEQFTKLVADLPADQVPLKQRTPEGVKSFTASLTPTNSADETVRKQLGLSKEAWEKHNNAA